MPKTLIAVISAAHRTQWRQAIRSTWLPLVPAGKADVRFFMGMCNTLCEDEIKLECDDSYAGLPDKIRAVTKWAYEQGYEHMLKCDDDTVLKPTQLLNSGYERHAYSGRANRFPGRNHPYTVPVGFNWWINRECMEIIANSALPVDGSNDDEKWVASKLHEKGITLVNAEGYEIHMGFKYEQRPPSRLYRPAQPPPLPSVTATAFSWTIFLEADSGNSIPLERKLSEFRSTFANIQNQ